MSESPPTPNPGLPFSHTSFTIDRGVEVGQRDSEGVRLLVGRERGAIRYSLPTTPASLHTLRLFYSR